MTLSAMRSEMMDVSTTNHDHWSCGIYLVHKSDLPTLREDGDDWGDHGTE